MMLAEIPFPAIDPVAFSLGPLHVRWYGLAYLAGFLCGGIALDRLVKDGFLPLTKDKVSDLIGWLVIATILGGRLGYALFYEQRLLTHPHELLRVWEGGLSFHGGLLGIGTASWLFARRHKVPWRRIHDALVLAGPFGLFFVRCANFINAELYGRVASPAVPWAMRFPTDPAARTLDASLAAGGGMGWYEPYSRLKATGQWDQIASQVPLRHPSQLYEALLEGVVTGVVLWIVYKRKGKALREGRIAGLFLLLYAVSRFLVEFVREPDAQLGTVLGPFSMGQVLSLAVAGFGAVLVWRSNERSNVPSSAL